MSPAQKMEQTANEIDNTIRFLEDREKKKIGSIWVRSAVDGAAEDDLGALKDRLSPMPVAEFASPWPLEFRERHILSPLIGQVSR